MSAFQLSQKAYCCKEWEAIDHLGVTNPTFTNLRQDHSHESQASGREKRTLQVALFSFNRVSARSGRPGESNLVTWVGRAQDRTWKEEATKATEHHDLLPDPCPVLHPDWDVILECHSYRLVGKPNGEWFWPPFALQMQSKLPQNRYISGTWVVQCDCVGRRWGWGGAHSF